MTDTLFGMAEKLRWQGLSKEEYAARNDDTCPKCGKGTPEKAINYLGPNIQSIKHSCGTVLFSCGNTQKFYWDYVK